MRLWSVRPDLLDRAALAAGWREGLLAQKVLRGLTAGYTQHPQLARFRTLDDPVSGIATWLDGVATAAEARGYTFDRTRIAVPAGGERLPLHEGQLEYEWQHLRAKVAARDPAWLPTLIEPAPHPMFDLVPGGIEDWERP